MQADYPLTMEGDPSEWGRWIDELRHRELILVTDGSLESFNLFQLLGVDDWPVQYRTADDRRVTIERKSYIISPAPYQEVPSLVFTAEGRRGTVTWMVDIPTSHFLLTPKGFDWLDRAIACVDDRLAPDKDNPTGEGVGGGSLTDPIPVVSIVECVGHKAGRSDKLAEKMKRRNYPVEKLAGKYYCQRADAIAMFPRHKQRIEEI